MNLQQPKDAFLLVNVYINSPFTRRESTITDKKGDLSTLGTVVIE